MASGCRLWASGLGAICLGALVAAIVSSPGALGAQRGLYTTEQAERGSVVFEDKCVVCHGGVADITPGMAALLGDRAFRTSWTGRSLGELFGLILETMPQDEPGTLSPTETADLVAYILSGNRFPPGDDGLSSDIERLMGIPFEP